MNDQQILILENDKQIPDEIAAYIDDRDYEATIMTELNEYSPDDIWSKAARFKHIGIQSTFTDAEQIASITRLISSLENKKFHILTTGERLHYLLHQITDKEWQIKNFLIELFQNNEIFEIAYQRKEDPAESGHFFKSFLYYFDQIKMYYNKQHEEFFPERPKCFFNNELKSIYKYKPKWTETNA